MDLSRRALLQAGGCFVDPRFEDEASGSSGDDHPKADIRAGEQFLDQVYAAVTSSPNWPSTVLVVNIDEWGGFFDHVAHDSYDHTSVLKLIEWRWGLPALTPRDAAAGNLAEVLDFGSAPDLTAPSYSVPPFVTTVCPPVTTTQLPGAEDTEWTALTQ